MKNNTFFHILLAGIACLLASCVSSTDTYETEVYEDTAISSFTIGTVTVTHNYGKKKDGVTDSIKTESYSGSKNKVTIDHYRYDAATGTYGPEIFNADSLPAGSSMKFLVSVSSVNSNTIRYKPYDEDPEADDNWKYFSASDTIDFSTIQRFRVISPVNGYKRDYKVTLVAHNEEADSFQYKQLPSQTFFENAKSLKGAATSQAIFVLADGALYKSDADAYGDTWTKVEETEANSIVSMNDSVFIYGNSKLMYYNATGSKIGEQSTTAITTLAGACNGELYGISTDGKVMVCKDRKSGEWSNDNMESDKYYNNSSYIPAKDISCAVVTSKVYKNVSSITMVGNMADEVNPQDTCAVVWNKYVGISADECWTYNKPSSRNKNLLPRLSNISVTGYYEGWMLAIGGQPLNSNVLSKAYDKIYCSDDGGITWTTKKGLRMPEKIAADKAAVIVADKKGYFYIITADGGKVMRGKYNNATWAPVTTVITNE